MLGRSSNRSRLGLFGILVGALLAGCAGAPPPGNQTVFPYEVAGDVEEAWIITHNANGNVLASQALAGTGEVTLAAAEDGFVTLAVRDTWNEGDATKRAVHLVSYPTSAVKNRTLVFAHWPWLKPSGYRSVTIRATCPPGAAKIVVRGHFSRWDQPCTGDTERVFESIRADYLANRDDGQLGVVLWAFDEEDRPTHVAVIEAFDPNEVLEVGPDAWSDAIAYSELRITYPSAEEAAAHTGATTIYARAHGGWYSIDHPGDETTEYEGRTIIHREPFGPLSRVDEAILWYWSTKYFEPYIEGADSILPRRESSIPETVELNESAFAPYPEYVDWNEQGGRIWVQARVRPPEGTRPTYHEAIVYARKGNEERQWTLVLFGDHRDGAVFPELPSDLAELAPAKADAEQAFVEFDAGTFRWYQAMEAPELSVAADPPWYVLRWKYVVGTARSQTLGTPYRLPKVRP